MSFSQNVKELHAKLQEILQETEQLQQRAEELERQNFMLQEQLAKLSNENGGLRELKQLYDEGYHICRDYFAQPRAEECLFCLSFLHRGGAPQLYDKLS